MSSPGAPAARYVLTGAPGAGKTAVLRALSELGYQAVAEAAADVIAARQAAGAGEPWLDPSFTDRIAALQRDRQQQAAAGRIQFFDRSPVCTLALARYLPMSIRSSGPPGCRPVAGGPWRGTAPTPGSSRFPGG